MAHPQPSATNQLTDVGLEFRSSDGAWYDVQVTLHNDVLTINYSMLYGSPHTELHDAKQFETLDDVVRFRTRFRPVSAQVQDNECSSVVNGVKVCASYRDGVDDLRYYDAVVEQVDRSEHSIKEGEEQCLCTFILFWETGPGAGHLTPATVEDICLLQYGEIDKTVDEFIGMARKMVLSSTMHSGQAPREDLNPESQSLNSQNEDRCNSYNEDIDMGGEVVMLKKYLTSGFTYAVTIDNLEKDLTPWTVTNFILKETTIISQAHIFPSLLADTYTEGTIEVKSKEDFIKLNEFLQNTNHIIVSSRNRPWVITERFWKGEVRTIMLTLEGRKRHNAKNRSELKIVQTGTPEFDMAKQRRENFTDFYSHMKRMVIRHAFEEKRIMSRWTNK